ncbi:MAG: tetratricopeptide repeat protein [Candidatus Flexifilum sp.]|jgi:tetratricopeptide (TPR) repeat protein
MTMPLRRSRALIRAALIIGLILGAGAPASAQMTPAPTPTPLARSLIEAQATASAVIAEIRDRSAALDGRYEDAERVLSRAFDLLNLFQVLGVVFGVIGLAGVVGALQAWWRLQTSTRRIEADLHRAIRERNDELKALARRSATASAMMNLAERQYRSGDRAGAIHALIDAQRENPENPRVSYLLGYYLEKDGQYEAAQDALDRALQVDHDYRPALAARGLVERRLARREYELTSDEARRDRRYARAADFLERALDGYENLIDEDGESWYGALGGLHYEQGNFASAIRYYERAAAIVQEASYPLINLALLLLEHRDDAPSRDAALGYLRKALEITTRRLQISPRDRYLYSDRIIALGALGGEQDLEQTLAAYLELGGDPGDPLGRLARLQVVLPLRRPILQPIIDRLERQIAAASRRED